MLIVRTLLADFRYAFRVLSRTPSFSLAVIAVLAIGIGANTAIFSIVNAVLLRPLPFTDADRIVRVFQEPPQNAFPGIRRFSVSAANFYDWKRDTTSFERLAIYRSRQFALTSGNQPEAIVAGTVGADFFETLGGNAALGRVFLPEEDAPGRSKVVVLSDGFWKSHLGGAPDVVGRPLMLDGEPYQIVGVMPATFTVEAWTAAARDIWIPLAYTETQRAIRENHNAAVVGRLKPGVTVAQAQSEMELLSKRLEREYPQENAGWGASVVALQEVLVGDIRLSLIMLLGAVALVLLIACANVGNLLFARALTRRKELAIRAALGAGRARVFQQLLVEALLLALLGGVLGLVLVYGTLGLATTVLADQIPRADEISIDGRVLLFVALVSILTGVLAGALPAMRAGRTDLNETLKEGGRHDSAVGLRTRRLLIVAEVALSLVLLMGAAVMLRSLLALRSVDTGFDARNVLTMQVSLPRTRYRTPEQMSGFFDAALERMRALPGVETVGAIDDLPVQGGSVQPILREGQAELPPNQQPTVAVRRITPGYLKTMNIPVTRGRDVAAGDADVMIVSRAAAKLLWGDGDPIGTRVTLPLVSRTQFKEVIGIAGDVKQGDLTEAAAATVYEYTRQQSPNGMAVVLRTSVPPLSLGQTAAGVVYGVDPQLPVQDIQTMENVLDETLTSQRLNAFLLGIFACVALVLASVGIYSVLAYIVRGRSREIGIRSALGAQRTDVVRLVVIEGMTPAIIGIVLGTIAALLSARVLERLVFGVSATDPATLAAVAAALMIVALAASLVPAYRASRVDVLKALREN